MLSYKVKEVAGIRPSLEAMRYAFKSGNKSNVHSDLQLALKLNKAGNPHNKILREMVAWIMIKAPLYWWKQADTYRMGFEKNSESTMHTITKFPFTAKDFGWSEGDVIDFVWHEAESVKQIILDTLNKLRDLWINESDPEQKRKYWDDLMDILPQSYLQTRMCMISYATLQKMWEERRGHKLREWQQFLTIVDELPLGFLIRGEDPSPDVEVLNGYADDLEDYIAQMFTEQEDANVENGYANQKWLPYVKILSQIGDDLLFYDIDLNALNTPILEAMIALRMKLSEFRYGNQVE